MKRTKALAVPQQQAPETPAPQNPACQFISVYRISLVRDQQIAFEHSELSSSAQAYPIIKRLIQNMGQPDREQFCILMLNAKNVIIGLNIVSTGDLSSAPVHPREVLKPAILANASAIILAHNHPSNNLTPSPADIAITRRIIRAAKIMGILVHEHLIISMDDAGYYSFSDNGMMKTFFDEEA